MPIKVFFTTKYPLIASKENKKKLARETKYRNVDHLLI
jgi:hypothetical protein